VLHPASSHSTNMLRDVIGVVSDTSRAIYGKLSVFDEGRDCGADAPRAGEESRRLDCRKAGAAQASVAPAGKGASYNKGRPPLPAVWPAAVDRAASLSVCPISDR
ncbi:MAG: hypothetical protein AB7U61_18285, partial [Methylocystis sp.]